MATTHFLWDPIEDNILQERDGAGALVAESTTEPGLYGNVVSQNRSGTEGQFHFDAVGSMLAVTDENHNVTDTFAYTAFGEVTERTGTAQAPFQYIGRKGYYRDNITGEYLPRRRPYRPVSARWLATDPLFDQSNLYTYVANGPISYIDPSGMATYCGEEEDPCKDKLKETKICIVLWGDTKMKAAELKLDSVNAIWKKCCLKFLVEKTIQIEGDKAKEVLGDKHEYDDSGNVDPLKLIDTNAYHPCRRDNCKIRIHIFDSVKLTNKDVGGFFKKYGAPGCWHVVFDLGPAHQNDVVCRT